MGRGRAEQHAGLGLPAVARVAVSGAAVKTNFDGVKRGKGAAKLRVDGINDLSPLTAAADVRLVRYHDEKEAGCLELFAGIHHVGIQLEVIDRRGRKGKSVPDHGPIEHTVPIQKNRAPFYFVLSHFVCADFSAG